MDVVALTAPLEHARLVEVTAGDRADPVRPQELLLVEQGREDASQPVLVDEREQTPALGARAGQVGERRHGVGEVLDELRGPLHELGVAVDHVGVEHGRRAQRQEAHERAHLEPDRLAVGHAHHVVVEAVVLVPENGVAVRRVEGDRDPLEMRDELERHVGVGRVALGQLDGDLQHPLAVERHPRRAVRLLEGPAAGQRRRAVEDADVVESEEPALEEVAVVGVLAVHPPREVRQQPAEDAGQELVVALAPDLRLALVDVQRGPRGDGRVDVAEVPFVRRDLAVRMQVSGAEQELDLLFGEVDIHQ